jgi:excisionase family DNA binding protein
MHSAPQDRSVQRLSYSPDEAALALGVGRSMIYGLIAEHVLPVAKAGKRTLISHEDLVAFLRRGGRAA